MKDKAQQLRDELDRIIQGYLDAPQKVPVFFPPELVERVVAYVREAMSQGGSMAQCSDQLNISKARLHYWMYGRKKTVRSVRRPPPPVPTLRPVQVSAEKVPVYDGVRETRYTFRSPSGWELAGLTLQELTELLRGLV